MAGLGGMNVGNAFGGVPQNAGTTQQGSTLQSLPGMGTSTAQQTQQSVAQTPSTLGYAPQQNAQNVFGYNMGRLASAMDPSATLPFYNQYASPYYQQPQQTIDPYQGVADILGSLGSFFNESVAPTFQSAYDQQFQNFQNQLNQMSQQFAPAPPPPAPPSVNYMSEIDALRQQIAQLQGQIANPVIPTPAPTPAPVAAPTPASSLTIAQAREQLNRGSGLNAREAANILGVPVVNPRGITRNPVSSTSPVPAPTPVPALAATPSPVAQQFFIPASQNIAPSPTGATNLNTFGPGITVSSAPTIPGFNAPATTPTTTSSSVAQQFAIPASQNIAPSPAATSGSISLSSTPTPAPAPITSTPTPAPAPITIQQAREQLGRGSGLGAQKAANLLGVSVVGESGKTRDPKKAGGGEIEAFNPALNSGAQSNFMSSAERVYDLGPGYRELGVVPGNIAGGTAGPNVPYVAPPGLTPPPAASTTVAPIKYSQALSEYQKLGLGQQGIFGLATTPQQLADALKKPVIQKGKTYTPKITSAAHGGIVHGGMTNRLKHMLK